MGKEGNEDSVDLFLDSLPGQVENADKFGVAANVIHEFRRIMRNDLASLIVGTHAEAALAVLALYPHPDGNSVKNPDGSNTDVCKVYLLSWPFSGEKFP